MVKKIFMDTGLENIYKTYGTKLSQNNLMQLLFYDTLLTTYCNYFDIVMKKISKLDCVIIYSCLVLCRERFFISIGLVLKDEYTERMHNIKNDEIYRSTF